MLVRTSFTLVVPLQDTIADVFYERLFTKAPELRCLFPEDLSGQKGKLMALLATCVGRLHDVSTMILSVKSLGVRHVAYGARPEHYPIIAEALLWALGEGLGSCFTREVRFAWSKVLDLLAATMQAGVAELAEVRAAS
jgi:nitric oxide dioxygenase